MKTPLNVIVLAFFFFCIYSSQFVVTALAQS